MNCLSPCKVSNNDSNSLQYVNLSNTRPKIIMNMNKNYQKETKTKASPILLEPIMDVEVVVPNDYVGNVIGDVTSRRGRLESQEGRGNAVAIRALVPLSEMFGYATSLRSNTQGRATFMMQFAHYDKCPKSIMEEIIKKRGSN